MLHAAREATRATAAGDIAATSDARPGAALEMLDLVPAPVLVVAPDRRVVSVNRAHEAEFGPPNADATCCSIVGCGTQEGNGWRGCLTDLILAGGHTTIPTTLTRDPSGRALWVSAGRFGPDGSHVVFRLRKAGDADGGRGAAAPADDRLRIFTLGTTDVRTPAGASPDREWLSQRPGRMLKYLVVQRGRPVVADKISETLWPRFARRDSGSVRHAVHLLRRRLEPDRSVHAPSRFILTTQGSYALNLDRVWVDADAFETAVRTGLQAFVTGDEEFAERSLSHALELYRGDFLLDDLYEDWAMEERERLRALVEVPLRVLAEMRLRGDDCDGAARYVERLSQVDPFDADVHRLLVEVLLRQGRRSRALRQYEMYSARLMRDFGVRPDFDLRHCQRRAAEPLHAL